MVWFKNQEPSVFQQNKGQTHVFMIMSMFEVVPLYVFPPSSCRRGYDQIPFPAFPGPTMVIQGQEGDKELAGQGEAGGCSSCHTNTQCRPRRTSPLLTFQWSLWQCGSSRAALRWEVGQSHRDPPTCRFKLPSWSLGKPSSHSTVTAGSYLCDGLNAHPPKLDGIQTQSLQFRPFVPQTFPFQSFMHCQQELSSLSHLTDLVFTTRKKHVLHSS